MANPPRSRKRVLADFRRAPDGSAFQKWETFAKTCEGENVVDIDRRACIVWKNMSTEEQLPYILQEKRVDAAYTKALLQESNDLGKDDDEADSRDSFQRRLYDYDLFKTYPNDDDNFF